MSITLPKINLPPTPKAFFDLLQLEGGPHALPLSKPLAGASLAAYVGGEAGLQYLDHQLAAAILFGVVSAVFLAAVTAAVLHFMGTRDRLVQTLTALGATGAAIAVVTIVLHFLFAQVFPPPMPTGTLVRFLLFPLVLWNIMLFAWLYRHASLRVVPAFCLAAAYVGVTTFIIAPLVTRVAG